MRDRFCLLVLTNVSFLVGLGMSPAWAAERPRVGAPDAARVAEIAAMLDAEPRGAGAPITDRKVWDKVAHSRVMRHFLRRADRLLEQRLPDLPDDLFLDFSRTGNRERCQAVLSQRQHRLANLVLTECLENRGRFLPAIEEAIRAVLDQKTWVLPAHDPWLRNFRGEATEIDLRAAAIASGMATTRYWLGDKLSAETRKLIRGELERRIFAPFQGSVEHGKPGLRWLRSTTNWNAVCLAGVVGAATATIEDRQRRALFIAAGEKYIQCFLDGFTPDGYCSEGLGYWNYGFGHFMLLAEDILQATGGKLDLWQRPKVEAIARFARRLEILPGVYPSFADCHLDARPDERIMVYVSRRFGWGWSEWEKQGLGLAAGASSDLFEFGLVGLRNSASRRTAVSKAASEHPLREWFADAGILICRPSAENPDGLGAALKGGHNAEHHNHNDVGSFVVALGTVTPLLDPGSEVYTRRTFSPQRYDSNLLNSFGHSVPRVAGRLQRTGPKAAAKVLQSRFTDEEDTLTIDLRSCYDVPELTRLARTFKFSRKGPGSLTVHDAVEFTSAQHFETALITMSPWKQIGDDTLVIGEGPHALQAKISTGGRPFRVEATEICEDMPAKGLPTRLGIVLTEPVRQAVIQVRITQGPAGARSSAAVRGGAGSAAS